MQRGAIVGAKAAIAMLLAASLVGHLWFIPLAAWEVVSELPAAAPLQLPGIVGCVAIVACVQVTLLALWRLLSLLAHDRIFDASAFRPVTAIIASAVAAAALFAAALVILASANAMPPSVGALLVVGMLTSGGIALVVIVMRELLRKATALEHELAAVV
ncbi:DUF2975 domain-containing protein [Agrococcus sp. DT81.2]|uniref:DUF2975 domain-containing protein n=1 Tax=Agrococcus sp. DT81.2 TaxID=3393414 RepID=UPI003CE45428